MAYVVSCIADAFSMDLFIIWSGDNAEKLVIHFLCLFSIKKDEEGNIQIKEDVFLCQIKNTMLNNISLHSVDNIC